MAKPPPAVRTHAINAAHSMPEHLLVSEHYRQSVATEPTSIMSWLRCGLLVHPPQRGRAVRHFWVSETPWRPQRSDDGEDNGSNRYREVRAGDAEERCPRGDGKEDHRRMQVNRAALNDRLEKVAFDELDSHDDSQGGERELPATVCERNEHGHKPRDERADERDEGAHEDEHRQRERERHAEHPQTEPDQR